MESCIYIHCRFYQYIYIYCIYIYIYCIYNIRTYICSYKVWIIDLSITSLSWFDHYMQHILCQLSGIQKAGGHQHSMGDLLGQMWMGSFLPSFWFVRSTRIYWANRCQLEPSTTGTLVPAFNCTESEMLLFFQAFSPWFHHCYCVGTYRSQSVYSVRLKRRTSDSTNKCQRRHPSALPHFSQRCMEYSAGDWRGFGSSTCLSCQWVWSFKSRFDGSKWAYNPPHGPCLFPTMLWRHGFHHLAVIRILFAKVSRRCWTLKVHVSRWPWGRRLTTAEVIATLWSRVLFDYVLTRSAKNAKTSRLEARENVVMWGFMG